MKLFHPKLILSILLLSLLAINADKDFRSAQYQSLKAEEKINKLWTSVNQNQTPYGWYKYSLPEIFIYDMRTTFNDYSDIIEKGRKKLIHSFGVVGKVEFIADPNPYSGIFKGCKNVLLRLSVAKNPDYSKRKAEEAFDNFGPGLGIKFLRDGVPSANLVAMFSVEGQKSWNFFKNDFTNHISGSEKLPLKILGIKFSQAQSEIGTIGLKTLAQYDERGFEERNPNFPFKMLFRPRAEVKNLFSDNFTKDYVSQLKTIEANTPIYDVYVAPKPNADLVKVGTLITSTKFVTSEFGDKDLFFQHNFIEQDYQIHPEWRNAFANPEFLKMFHSFMN